MTKMKKILITVGTVSMPLFAVAAVSCSQDTKESLTKQFEKVTAGEVANKAKIVANTAIDKSVFKFNEVPSGYEVVVGDVTVNATKNTTLEVKATLRKTGTTTPVSGEKSFTFEGFKATETLKTAAELTTALAAVSSVEYTDKATKTVAMAVKDKKLDKLVFTTIGAEYEATEVKLEAKTGTSDADKTTLVVKFKIRQIGQTLTSSEKTLEVSGFKAA